MNTRLRAPDLFLGMNATERAFAAYLEAQKRSGDIRLWRFGRFTLKLADDTRYTPDFYVLENSGAVTLYEVKGFFRDDAKVKLKVAATDFPEFRWKLVQKGKISDVEAIA